MGVPRGRDIIVIGGSAGGVRALQQILRALPRDLAAATFIVLHRKDPSLLDQGVNWPMECGDALPNTLDRGIQLPIQSAVDDEHFKPGHIYVSPAGQHLLVERGKLAAEDYRPYPHPHLMSGISHLNTLQYT